MKIVVRSNTIQYEQFINRGIPAGIGIILLNDVNAIPDADAYFDLLYDEAGPVFTTISQQPVFANAVITTSQELPGNYIRINAWNSFFSKPILELVSTNNHYFPMAVTVLEALNWQYHIVADTPGMIAARVIAMIINEAYFGLGEGISTKEEIDIAMKSGTNYPYGPFEWSEKIGLHKVYALLKKLQEQDKRYEIAAALEREVKVQLAMVNSE